MTQNHLLPFGSFRHFCALSMLTFGGLTFGCGEVDAPDELPSNEVHSIQNGWREYGHPAVGQVGTKSTETNGTCTGTLIDKNWIVTTRHCKVLDAFLTGSAPGKFKQHKLGKPLYSPRGYVTLVPLLEPITDIKPVDYHGKLPGLKDVCLSVGFGYHNNADGTQTQGTKYSATSIVADVANGRILVTPGSGAIAGGDSGGPLLCKGKIVGVAESGGAQFSARGLYPAIDADWVEKMIANPEANVAQAPDPGATPAKPAFDFYPEVRLLGSSGALCPEGSIESEGASFQILTGTTGGPVTKDTTQQCRMDLLLSVPAGLKPEKLAFELFAQTTKAALPSPATWTLSTPGEKSVRVEERFGPLARTLDATLDGGHLSCQSHPTELRVSLEFSARVPRGEQLLLGAVGLKGAEDLVWSKCADQAGALESATR